jgi:hypothetical protein
MNEYEQRVYDEEYAAAKTQGITDFGAEYLAHRAVRLYRIQSSRVTRRDHVPYDGPASDYERNA